MARSKHSLGVKLQVLQLLNEGDISQSELCDRFSVSKSTIQRWKMKFDKAGVDGLIESTTWSAYSKELKDSAVKDFLQKDLTDIEILEKYNISSNSVLRTWVKKYTSHSELKDSSKGMSQTMTKGRKTTFEERIQIVDHCLKNQKNYQATSEIYEVSYQQVYQWVKKFEASGDAGLRDRRGHTKEEPELTAEEKLQLEIKRIQRENERLCAENLFLKKLEEIERRRR
jgi:transposase